MSDESRELLQRWCREGDQGAFTRFYRAQTDRLWRYLRSRGSSAETAYDQVAEAFLRFLQSVCRDPSAPVALLYRIAINLQIDEFRRNRASPVVPDADGVAEAAAAPAGISDDEHAYVRLLVGRLPEDEQNLLLLRYWIGLTHREIAEMLGMPEGTVRRRAAELLAGLRARWGQD
jgi:RNA polymerase sigma-70 factor (ECF subfamily)